MALAKPNRLRLTSEELKAVIAQAKNKALETRRRLGQQQKHEEAQSSSKNGNKNNNKHPTSSNEAQNEDDDDAIMKEYGLDDYDDEDLTGSNQRADGVGDDDMSEDEANEQAATATMGTTRSLADDISTLTYHASNDEDPYLKQGPNTNIDDEEEEEELTIKPSDNLIVAGHVSKSESSIEVYVYDNDQNHFYLHHDIIQADFPCCVRWIGHVRGQSRNVAAAGYMNPDIYLWDLDVVDVLEPMETLSGHTDAVIDICWNSHIKNTIASGSADKHVRLWDLDECKSVSNIKLTGKVSALEFGLYEQFLLLAGDLNRNVSVIDTRSGKVVNKWQITGEAEKVRWVPRDQSKFLVSDDQGYVYCFDLRHTDSKQPTVKFRPHQISVTGLEFSPKCDDMLVTASADDTIKVWDTRLAFKGAKTAPENDEPILIKELANLDVGSILSLRMCPNSVARIAVGGDGKCNSFTTYDLTKEKEGK